MDNFDIYAKRFETLIGDPVFIKYPDFKEMLDYLGPENCQGYRYEQCKLFKTCGVCSCHQEKKINYCYGCDEFPCQKTGFDEHLHARWIKLNERIRAVGIEQCYTETKDQPRYA